MNTKRLVFITALGGLVTLGVGCNKQQEVAPPVVSTPQTEKKADATVQEVQKATEAVKSTATQAVQAVSVAAKAAMEQAPGDNAQVQGLIDAAKKLVAEGKWQEVAGKLAQLKDAKLTPEQVSALAELKEKLDKMVQESLGKKPLDAGGLLPK